MQTNTAKISSFRPLQMHYFKYLKSRRIFNNFRRKIAITPFFSEFNELQGETSYQLGSYPGNMNSWDSTWTLTSISWDNK